MPEHFYVEVLGALRRQLQIEQIITESQADAARGRLRRWSLRVASVRPLGDEAWIYRHNMSMADAFYVALADHLGVDRLTDDHKLVGAPTFPSRINVLRLPKPA